MASAIRNVGLITLIGSMLAFLVALAGLGFGEWQNAVAFLSTAVVGTIAGFALFLPCKNARSSNIQIAYATAFLGWGMFSVLASLPFWIGAHTGVAPDLFQKWDNSFFEGMSAATSTGLTVTPKTSALAASLQLWRSICQWVGGLGVLVLALTLFESLQQNGLFLRAAGRKEKIDDDVGKTLLAIWKVHGLLTVAVILALMLAGMHWWEAINHGLVTVSTGGFTMNDEGMAGYSRVIQGIVMLGMFTGAISFLSHYKALIRFDLKAWVATSAHKVFYSSFIAGLIVIGIFGHRETDIFDLAFLWISALTTSGFSTVPLDEIPGSVQLVLVAAMFFGGMAGSTAGGVKLNRIMVLAPYLWRFFRVFLAESKCQEMNKVSEELEKSVPLSFPFRFAFLILGLWVTTSVVGTALLILFLPDIAENNPLACLFETVSALGCVGLSSGVTSPDLPITAKLLLCLLMWTGRIEIVPGLVFLALLLPGRWKDTLEDSKCDQRSD